MKNYVKPMILANEELAEGVYAASGCWTITAREHQANLDVGRDNYCFQLDAKHADVSGHGLVYTITITFDQPVTFDSSTTLEYKDGNNTNTLVLQRTNGSTNPNEEVGLGDLYVKYAGAGAKPGYISVVGITMTD